MATVEVSPPAPIIDGGFIMDGRTIRTNSSNGGTTEISITFNKTFYTIPHVIAQIYSNNKDYGSNVLYISAIVDIDESGCKIRVGNLGNSDVTLTSPRGIRWIALGY